MRSSPAFAVSSLELPAVRLADRVADVLVVLATAFLAWACVRAEVPVPVVAGLGLAGVLAVAQRWRWARHQGRQPARHLQARPDGTLWLHQAGRAALAVTVGRGTRQLGPSVFLDLEVSSAQAGGRLQCWITPFDVPGHVLRRWNVVLPRCGRAACT